MDTIAVEPTDSEALNEARAQVAITTPERLAASRVWYSDSITEQGKPQTPAEEGYTVSPMSPCEPTVGAQPITPLRGSSEAVN